MRTLILIYIATLVQCYRSEVRGVRHGGRSLIRHGRSRVHFARMHGRARDLVAQIEAERSSELEKNCLLLASAVGRKRKHRSPPPPTLRESHDGGRRCGYGSRTLCRSLSKHKSNLNFIQQSIDKSGEDPVIAALRPYAAPDDDDGPSDPYNFQKIFGNSSVSKHEVTTDDVSLVEHFINVEHSYDNNDTKSNLDENSEIRDLNGTAENVTISRPVHEDVVTKFLRLIETQHLLGENCTAGTHLNLGEGVVDRYAQERFRIEADVAVNRANMLTRLWKYAGPSVMHNEYLLHASVFSMVEFDDDIFAAGNCYDQLQYKDYQLFCPFAYRLPEGPILAKDLAVEYKYLSNTSEWFYIARKNAERVIRNHNQFRRGYNTYTYNDTAHTDREPDEILSVTYEDGKWSKPYYDCGGGNIWMLTYTVPFFGFNNGSYFFKGTSGIDIDLRRVDIDQCPIRSGSTQLNIFAGTDKCKKKTTECVPMPGLGFRRGSYRCVCRRGFYFPNTTADNRYYNGSDIEEEYEKHLLLQRSLYSIPDAFECLPCAEGCEACLDGSPCVAALNWVVRTTIFALACLVISCLPFIVYFTIKYGHVRVVRAASPALLRVIVLGALLIYCTTLVMYGRPTVLTCTARVWLREVGFCLTYGALMLKTWRISVIFQVRSAKAVKISDMYLLRRIGVIVGVACVLLAIRTLVAPPAVIVGRTKDDLKAYLCNTDWWDHSFTTLEVIFLMWGIRLCIMVRKAPSEFNESRFISMAIYNEFLLSVFLNISMLFLQSPANPDLLYIIFFCHTQLTVTLLLCFIFGSKAYMVYKGHGKDEREKTGKFRSRPADSTYTMTTNRSARFCDNMTERELEEEFRKICNQLEKLRERCGPGAVISRRIGAMQDAAAVYDRKPPPSDHSAPLKLNTVFSAVADRLMCTVTPAEESSSSGRELPFEAPPAYKHKTFSPTKSTENSNAEQSQTDVTTDSPKKRIDLNEEPKEDKQNGVFKISGEANCSDIRPPEVSRNGYNNKSEKTSELKSSPSSTETVKGVRSGHARTHAIVINLDDKSRFTEEVTV